MNAMIGDRVMGSWLNALVTGLKCLKGRMMSDRTAMIQHGRKLVEAGEFYPLNQNHQYDLMKYHKVQREAVDRSGRCDARCECELVTTANGELVCPHTWRRCPGRALVNIVSLLEKVNS